MLILDVLSLFRELQTPCAMILMCFFNFILLIFSIFCIKRYSIGDCLQLVQVWRNRRMVLQKTIKWHIVLSFSFFLLLCVPLSFVSTWQEWNWSQMCNPGGLSVFIARVKFSPNIFVIRLHWRTNLQRKKKNQGGLLCSFSARVTYTLEQ